MSRPAKRLASTESDAASFESLQRENAILKAALGIAIDAICRHLIAADAPAAFSAEEPAAELVSEFLERRARGWCYRRSPPPCSPSDPDPIDGLPLLHRAFYTHLDEWLARRARQQRTAESELRVQLAGWKKRWQVPS